MKYYAVSPNGAVYPLGLPFLFIYFFTFVDFSFDYLLLFREH